MRKTFALALGLLLCFSVVAQDKPGKPAMDPAMIEAMMKAATPGPAHKMLDSMVGTWDTKITHWAVPGADPTTGTGVSESKWVLGGRYVEQRFKGNFMGMPFEGIGYSGYDNVKKQYFGTWMDNMSTGMMTSVATGSSGNVVTFQGTFADPMTGKDMTIEEKVTHVDNDHMIFEMFGPGPDGKNFRMMEIRYTRKK